MKALEPILLLLGHNVVISIDEKITDNSHLKVVMANQSSSERELAVATF